LLELQLKQVVERRLLLTEVLYLFRYRCNQI
jgi:hypothetical protein